MVDTFAPSVVQQGTGDLRPVEYGSDDAFHVEFYMREVEDEKETARMGRVMLKSVPYIKKFVAGDTRTVWDHPVREIDKNRWRQLWDAFERGEGEILIGTPLEAWPLLTADHRVALKNYHFKTVEQIAEATDSVISSQGHGVGPLIQNLRAHAQKWLKEQEAGALERKLMGQLEESENKAEAMVAQMQAMAQEIEHLKAQKMGGTIAENAMTETPQPEPEAPNPLANIPVLEDEPPKRKPGRPKKTEAA